MTPTPQSLWLEVEQAGDVTVVRFRIRALVKERTVESIGDTLAELANTPGRRYFVLNFERVEGLTSILLGKLIALARKVDDDAGGRVAVCGLSPSLTGLFESLKLRQMFSFYDGEEEAQKSFGTP